jgi:hypothetical protein
MPPKERPMLYDEDIRILLFDYLDRRFPKVRTFEEKNMGHSRSDVIALLPGAIMGIEIKSDADSYTRLATQIKDYDKYFDINFIAVGSSHLARVAEHIPPHWGILLVDQTEEEPIVRQMRPPKINPKVKLKFQLAFMWKRELLLLMKANKIETKAVRSRKNMESRLLAGVPEKVLKRQMCYLLFERDYSVFEKNAE